MTKKSAFAQSALSVSVNSSNWIVLRLHHVTILMYAARMTSSIGNASTMYFMYFFVCLQWQKNVCAS